MKKCGIDCIPCCDFCIHAIHEEYEIDGKCYMGGPIGCTLHNDEKHQNIAMMCGNCSDFICCNTEE